ncbi:hypothetical protein [Cohnella soli]|uniref:Uncharacterized protein n=1 Tax=Cohnella soli TaxID=425005 RepID=A0ABW0HM84_9BACL
MDVNEKIVEAWLTTKNFFMMSTIDYAQFHKDIDILAVNVADKVIWDCEVKIRTGSTKISETTRKRAGFVHIRDQLNNQERDDKIREIIGNDHDYEISKRLITTYSYFGSPKNRAKWMAKFNAENIEVMFIEDMVHELEETAKGLALSKNEVIQILRLQNIKNKRR